MLAAMFRQVDPLGRGLHAGERRADGVLSRDDEGDHRAVVGRVRGDVQDDYALHSRDGVADGVYHRKVASFGEVGDALDELHIDDGSRRPARAALENWEGSIEERGGRRPAPDAVPTGGP